METRVSLDIYYKDIDKATNTFINANLNWGLPFSSINVQNPIRWCRDYYQQKGWYNQSAHRQSFEYAPTKLKVSVNVNDADWKKIQELFAKERQWMTAQMQMHIREVNSIFADERKKVRERYKEYDGCYLGHYAQWFFWFFFGIFVVAGGIGMMIAQNYVK